MTSKPIVLTLTDPFGMYVVKRFVSFFFLLFSKSVLFRHDVSCADYRLVMELSILCIISNTDLSHSVETTKKKKKKEKEQSDLLLLLLVMMMLAVFMCMSNITVFVFMRMFMGMSVVMRVSMMVMRMTLMMMMLFLLWWLLLLIGHLRNLKKS